MIAAALGCVHLLACVGTDLTYGSPYPAYHDEFSYLFQAKTFLSGRWCWPSHEVPELFDQMHVLNNGVFASRYFPGAGFMGRSVPGCGGSEWAMPVAGGLAVTCATLAAMRLGGTTCGAVAGGMLACAPGTVVFSLFGVGTRSDSPWLVRNGAFVDVPRRHCRVRRATRIFRRSLRGRRSLPGDVVASAHGGGDRVSLRCLLVDRSGSATSSSRRFLRKIAGRHTRVGGAVGMRICAARGAEPCDHRQRVVDSVQPLQCHLHPEPRVRI